MAAHDHPTSEILAKLLEDENKNVFDGVMIPVYVSNWPDSQEVGDDLLAVYDTTGTLQGRLFRGGQQIEHPGWQVRSRALHYPDGRRYLELIKEFFESVYKKQVSLARELKTGGNVTSVYEVQSIRRTSTIIPLDTDLTDRKRREGFSLNGTVVINLLTTTPNIP